MSRKIVLALINYPMVGIGTISRKIIEDLDKSERITARELIREEQILDNKNISTIDANIEHLETRILNDMIPNLLNHHIEKLETIDQLIIDDYPFRREQLEVLKENLNKKWELKLFMVKLSTEELQRRLDITLSKTNTSDKERENRIRNRITEKIEELEKMSIYMDEIIDSTNLTLDELKMTISKRILSIE